MKSQTLAIPGHARVKEDSAVNGLSIMLCKHWSCKSPEYMAVRINNPCYEDKHNLLTITGFCTDHSHGYLSLPLHCCAGILWIWGIFTALLLPEVGACAWALFGEALVALNGFFNTLEAPSWGCCPPLQFPVSAQLFVWLCWEVHLESCLPGLGLAMGYFTLGFVATTAWEFQGKLMSSEIHN